MNKSDYKYLIMLYYQIKIEQSRLRKIEKVVFNKLKTHENEKKGGD